MTDRHADPTAATGPDLVVERANGVLRLVLNRPTTLNAASAAMVEALSATLEQAVGDDDVRAVVLTGEGRAFCSGADLAGLDPAQVADGSAMVAANRAIRAITGLDKPVLAAVNGPAAGFGCALALACDVVVAHPSATFSLTFTRLGLMPDGASTATVAASVGRARAMRMALLGERLDANEAYLHGLVSHVTTEDTFTDLVGALTEKLAEGAPLAMAATKKAINAASLPHLEQALETEHRGQMMLARTADLVEGMTAFVERRSPKFRGA
ncbi:enoyl-CoA hydratase [Nocardioides sp. Y6]|uniref:Enoyl-CoA hydratase n=1 Tax=Nocardioides malaquae TaxID=2773426 RepID=A0ABR9RQA7_9ACTN|nr:enoyl-CoA hydratase [Nocardioides malaquae]MBE7323755.1 enoyl-CoA hydratase [Nocardioides malaquae]